MNFHERLLLENQAWAYEMQNRDPDYFSRLGSGQSPEAFWIGCSDSRVPANEIVDLLPGELFVHRNIANVVVHSDMNAMSVLQFAVEVLRVRHIIVTGHYGCGGVRAAMEHDQLGLIDNWLRHIKDVYRVHATELAAIDDRARRADRLCELNVAAQVRNVCHTTIVQNAWTRGQELAVHGWVYGLADGRVTDLDVDVHGRRDIDRIYHMDAGM